MSNQLHRLRCAELQIELFNNRALLFLFLQQIKQQITQFNFNFNSIPHPPIPVPIVRRALARVCQYLLKADLLFFNKFFNGQPGSIVDLQEINSAFQVVYVKPVFIAIQLC